MLDLIEIDIITPRPLEVDTGGPMINPPITLVEVFGGTAFQLLGVTFAGHFRIKPDGTFQLWNGDQSKWHTISISGAAGAETLDVAAGET